MPILRDESPDGKSPRIDYKTISQSRIVFTFTLNIQNHFQWYKKPDFLVR